MAVPSWRLPLSSPSGEAAAGERVSGVSTGEPSAPMPYRIPGPGRSRLSVKDASVMGTLFMMVHLGCLHAAHGGPAFCLLTV